jgi:hypothetical protein
MRASTARLAGEFLAALHYGPGPHPDGSPQSVHGGGAKPARPRGPLAFAGQMAFDFEHRDRQNPEPHEMGVPYHPDPKRVAEAESKARKVIAIAARELGMSPADVERMALQQLQEWGQSKPITIHLSQDAARGILETGRYKTGFETSPEHFDELNRRMIEERGMGVPKNTPPERRPVYAIVQVAEYDGGVWGDIELRLKDDVKQRSTVTLGDSLAGFGTGAQVAMPLEAPGVAALGGDAKMIAGAVAGEIRIGTFSAAEYSYLEAQVHGGVTLNDVAEIVIPAYGDGKPFYPSLVEQAQRRGLHVRLRDAGQDTPEVG